MKALKQLAVSHGGWVSVVVLVNSLLALCLLLPRQQDGEWRLFGALTSLGTPAAEKGSAESGADGPGPMVAVPNVNVMLHSGDLDYYVEAAFALEVATERDREVVSGRMPRLREASIGFLSGLTPDELRGSRGLEKTKATLLESFRKVVPAQRLRAVYVTNLVVD